MKKTNVTAKKVAMMSNTERLEYALSVIKQTEEQYISVLNSFVHYSLKEGFHTYDKHVRTLKHTDYSNSVIISVIPFIYFWGNEEPTRVPVIEVNPKEIDVLKFIIKDAISDFLYGKSMSYADVKSIEISVLHTVKQFHSIAVGDYFDDSVASK